jgi:hypothetical protein
MSIPTMKTIDLSMKKFHSIKEVLPECSLGLTLLERVDLFGKFLKFKLDFDCFDQFWVVKGYRWVIRISNMLLSVFRAKQVKN